MAEEVGFEPTVPCGTTVFKTAAFDHSATPPANLDKSELIEYIGCCQEDYNKRAPKLSALLVLFELFNYLYNDLATLFQLSLAVICGPQS